MKKRDLERVLAKVPPHPKPKLEFEQYTTPPHVASRLLWIATVTYEDLPGDLVLDLGAGTGRLGIGAAILGSTCVVLVDVDREALKLALESARELGVDAKIDAICCDVRKLVLSREAVCVLQNPPFGVHRRGADVEFLRSALKLSRVVYSIHKVSAVDYVFKTCEEWGAKALMLFEETIRLPPTMPHHERREHRVKIAVLRAARTGLHRKAADF